MNSRIILLAASLWVVPPAAGVGAAFGAPSDRERMLTPEAGKAVVVLYRDDKLAASAIDYRPYLNDVPMAAMPNGTWVRALVPAGSYDLWLEQYAPRGQPRGVRSRAVEIHQWEAGRIYFIKVDSVRMPGLVSRAKGVAVESAQGLREIEGLREAGPALRYPVSTANRVE